MAIDKNKTRELLTGVDEIFASLVGSLPKEVGAFLKTAVMGPALQEIRTLIDESRPPVLFLAGRSGHGKSSLINALAGRAIADVGDIKPTTPESTPYLIHFEEQFSAWQVIDSRGIFETTRPDGAPATDAVEVLKRDLLKYRPDVLMHVISAPEMRRRFRAAGFTDVALRWTLFFPAFLAPLRPLERWLGWLPLGAQYCLVAR